MLHGLTRLTLILALVCGACRLHATPLHDAAQAGDLAQAGLLIMDDPSAVNVRDKRGYTPLSMAAQSGHVAVVKLLVEKGAAVDAKVNYPGAPAPIVEFYADPATVKLLIIKAPIKAIGATSLYIAAKEGHVGVAKVLLDNGAAINAVADDAGPPLSIAAFNGNVEMVRLLLERGAVVDAKTNDGVTSLARAAQGREGDLATRLEVMKLLLAKGANPRTSAFGPGGKTALQLADERGDVAIAELLREAGA